MKTAWGQRVTRVLTLAAVLLAAQASLRAESAPARGTLEIISSSGESMGAPFGLLRGRARRDHSRSDNQRDHGAFLLRVPVFRWDLRVAQVVHVTGNGRLSMTRSGTYIKGYKVEDGFLIPVLGTVTDGVTFGVPEQGASRGRSGGSAPEYLLRDPTEAEVSAAAGEGEPKDAHEPTVIEVWRPAAIRTTSLVGTLRQPLEGELEFLAANDGGEDIRYELLSPEPARKLLAEAETDELRVILIGKVNDDDPRAAIRVTAAYALAAPAK